MTHLQQEKELLSPSGFKSYRGKNHYCFSCKEFKQEPVKAICETCIKDDSKERSRKAKYYYENRQKIKEKRILKK